VNSCRVRAKKLFYVSHTEQILFAYLFSTAFDTATTYNQRYLKLRRNERFSNAGFNNDRAKKLFLV